MAKRKGKQVGGRRKGAGGFVVNSRAANRPPTGDMAIDTLVGKLRSRRIQTRIGALDFAGYLIDARRVGVQKLLPALLHLVRESFKGKRKGAEGAARLALRVGDKATVRSMLHRLINTNGPTATSLDAFRAANEEAAILDESRAKITLRFLESRSRPARRAAMRELADHWDSRAMPGLRKIMRGGALLERWLAYFVLRLHKREFKGWSGRDLDMEVDRPARAGGDRLRA